MIQSIGSSSGRNHISGRNIYPLNMLLANSWLDTVCPIGSCYSFMVSLADTDL